jgi:aminopeptidase N
MVIEFRDALAAYGLVPYVNDLLNKVITKKQAANAPAAQIEYIKTKMESSPDKKGF